jgi:hypothetical protein
MWNHKEGTIGTNRKEFYIHRKDVIITQSHQAMQWSKFQHLPSILAAKTHGCRKPLVLLSAQAFGHRVGGLLSSQHVSEINLPFLHNLV